MPPSGSTPSSLPEQVPAPPLPPVFNLNMTPNSHGSVTTVPAVAVSQSSTKISTHISYLPKVPSFFSTVPNTSNLNPLSVISMQAPTSPSPLLSIYHPPVVEARKSLTSLLESQMSLATSKPKSRSMYYGLTPAEYVAYGGIRTITSHHSPVPPGVKESSSNKTQSDVAVEELHVSKSDATKQLNGQQDLPSSMEVSAAHSLQPLSIPRDSERIVSHSKDLFEESQSEAHSTGIQSLKTSSMDTIEPELPLGLAQKTMQQSTSDVSTPKASYSEAPIPIPKAGEVHTQSAELFSIGAALNTTPYLTDSSGLLSSSSPLVKVDSNAEIQHSVKGIDIIEKGENEKKPIKGESEVVNATQQSGQIELAPVQSYQTAGGVSLSTANGVNVQLTAKPVKHLADCKNLVIQSPVTELEAKLSGSAIINGAFILGKQQAPKLISETPLPGIVATEAVLHKQREEVNQHIKASSGLTLPNKTNMGNTFPSVTANIEGIFDKIKTEPQVSNIFSKESIIATTGSILPHEPVTASVCSAKYNICTVSAAIQGTKIPQQPSIEIQNHMDSKILENKIHSPGDGLSLKSSQAPSIPNTPTFNTNWGKPTTGTRQPDLSVTAPKSPNLLDIKFSLDMTSNMPTKEPPKYTRTTENVPLMTQYSIGSSAQDKVVQGASFYTNSSRAILEATQATETSLNILAKNTILSSLVNVEPRLPSYPSQVLTELHPQPTNRRVALLTGKTPTEHLPTIPIREENIQTKCVIETRPESNLSQGNKVPNTETKLSNKPSAGLLTVSKSSADVVSPGQPGGVVAIQHSRPVATAQSNRSNLGNNVSIPAVDTKVPHKLHNEVILPVVTDPASQTSFNTVQVSKATVPSSPTMRHVTPKSPKLRSDRPATMPTIDAKPVSGSVAQTKVYANSKAPTANLLAEQSATHITNKTTTITELSPFIQPIIVNKSVPSPPTRTKNSTTSSSSGYAMANIYSVSVDQQTIAKPNQIVSGDNAHPFVNSMNYQTGVKQIKQSVTETKRSIETNIHTVKAQTASHTDLNNPSAINIQPLAETTRTKAPLSPATVTKPWTATRASPLPEQRVGNTPIRTYTPTVPQSPQTSVSLNHTTETKPPSVIIKDHTKSPIMPLRNNTPTSTVQPSAKSIKENISKAEIKSPTTKDTSVLAKSAEVKVHSEKHKIKTNLATNSSKEGKLSSLNTETSTPIHSADPVLTSQPTLKAQPPTKQVVPRPSSATVETKPPPNPVQISSHISNVQPSTELPVENISPAKPATDTVMKPSVVKAAVIDSATPASLPQASVSVKAPSPNRGTSPPSQQKTGFKDRTKTTAAPKEAQAVEPSTKSATSTASSTDKKAIKTETSPSSADLECKESFTKRKFIPMSSKY
uniref:Uncharacterized protein n=1 Tax=Dicentrarchus labrax TaxID=13489 RepID=A0A8P4KQS9_DICLA